VSSLDRFSRAMRSLIFAESPSAAFAGLSEYSVTAATGGTVNAEPTDPTLGLPPLTQLLLEPSVLGESATPAPGTLCLVQFVNGSPSRPEVVSVGPTVAAAAIDATGTLLIGTRASAVNVGAAQAPVARENDTVAVYLPDGTEIVIAGTCSLGPVAATIKLVDAATQQVPLPLLGILGPGSAKVFA
jgi:hypothetical protein